MTIFLLVIIYVVFVSLGLPDSIVGSSWPSIAQSLNVSPDYQGFLTVTISLCTIISSFLTIKLIKIFSSKWVCCFSVALTCIGIICMSFSSSFLLLCLSAIPFGLGAGAIDCTLNNYVALHYKAEHMNFLHGFWGLGTVISPFILSAFLTLDADSGWRIGLWVLASIQTAIFLFVLSTIFVWDKAEKQFIRIAEEKHQEVKEINLGFFKSFTIKGAVFTIIAFFSYIAVEQLIALWFSSMMAYTSIGINYEVATQWTAYFFIGIAAGRFVAGFVSSLISDNNRIRIGEAIILVGLILLMFNGFGMNVNSILMPMGVCLVGFGCGPVYPAIVHATPDRFTKELSQNIMSIQIGCAYIANITAAPLFGIIGENINIGSSEFHEGFLILPYVALIFLVLLTAGNELVLIQTKNKNNLIKLNNK